MKKIWIIWWWASWMMTIATLLEMWCKVEHQKNKWNEIFLDERLIPTIWETVSLSEGNKLQISKTDRYKDQIFLFEKNSKLGAKVLITWWGRCNLTTWIFNLRELLTKYPRGAEFLKKWLKIFWPKQVIQRFEKHGLETKIEKDNRVFPVSNKSKDVVWIFENLIKQHENVEVKFNEEVNSIEKIANQFTLKTTQWEYIVDILVIATGGSSYIQWAFNGYEMAKSLWHKITQIWPSLTSFVTQDEWPKLLSWTSVQNACLEVITQNLTKNISFWPLLFTHFGISWPAVFSMSALLAWDRMIDEKNDLTADCGLVVKIHLDKDKNFEFYDNFLLWEVKKNQNQNILNILSELFPKKLSEEVLNIAQIGKDAKIWEVKKEERKILCHLLSWQLELKIIGRRPWEEFVSAWWVATDEVNPETMESKICPNLYLCWEVLNVDGFTGGFNLQSAWMTWRVAGMWIVWK